MVLVVFNNQRIRKIRRSRLFFEGKGRRQWQIKQDGIAETLTDLKYVGESGESVIEGLLHGRFHPFSCFGRRFQEEGESGEGCSLIDDLLSLFD